LETVGRAVGGVRTPAPSAAPLDSIVNYHIKYRMSETDGVERE
jgi:hypothetical protein